MTLTTALKRQMRRMEESRLTAEEALDRAVKQYEETRKWPRRRFRLEGTLAGNSRLLTETVATAARMAYGGHIVELVPDRVAYCERMGIPVRTPASAVALAEGLPECALCGVAEGEPCKTSRGRRKPHRQRVKAWQTAEREREMREEEPVHAT